MDTIEQLVTKVSELLLTLEWKLVTAESCTGGGIAYHLTQLSGSSRWFERGFVTYSNLAKEECLHVSDATLLQFGAVSEQTAREMAEGALQNSQAQVSIAVTGIAGPDGGTPNKPVGTVWLAWTSIEQNTLAREFHFSGDREQVRDQAIKTALNGLMEMLQKRNHPEP